MQIQESLLPKIQINCQKNYQAQKLSAKSLPAEGFSLKYDPLDQYLVIVCGDGHKMLYSMQNDKFQAQVQCSEEFPSTCVKWRPTMGSTAKVIGVSNAEGFFEYWHIPSMKKMFSIQQKQNSIHCLDFNKTGSHFATAGKDCNIRIYDQSTKSISTMLGAASWNNRGHSNRIFSIKYIDDNTMVSGGWDSVIHIWDIRQGKSVKSFFGPHVAGDSIDIQNNTLLIGCYASKNQLQFWDIKNFQQTQTISWTKNDNEKVAYVYSACFSPKNKNLVLAGASGVNQVKMFEKNSDGKHELALTLSQLNHSCFSVDMCYKENQFAFSTAHHAFYRFKFNKK